MNRRSPGLKLSKAISGFLQFKTAEALSPTTLVSYEHHLRRWLAHTGDVDVEMVTTEHIRDFLAWLRTEYKPSRFSGNTQPLSPKTLHNSWITLCAFFTWMNREFNLDNPMRAIPGPKFEVAPIAPFTKEQVESLLKVAEYCKEANTNKRKKFAMKRPTARRDKAIILFLLDTGLRASEFCALRIADVDQKGKVHVRHGAAGGAKGGKGRNVYIGRSARSTLWRYLAVREDADDPEAPLFTQKFGRAYNKTALGHLIRYLGDRAGITECHTHMFRHTFAITFLRGGGDVFTLQALLGHSTLEMVQHYARIAEVDIAEAHRRASPTDHWHL